MYTVTLETVKKGAVKSAVQTFVFGEMDSAEYEQSMKALADVLFDLNMDFDDEEGDGDIIVDDILIAASEEELFERILEGRGCTYIVKGIDA